MESDVARKVNRLRKAAQRLMKEKGTPGSAPGGMERIPPGQYVSEHFPVLHYGPVPAVDLDNWELRIFGLVENPVTFSYEEFLRLPVTRIVTDIHCVTRWSMLETVWEGVPFREIAAMVKPLPEARFVTAHAEYGFTTSVPLEKLMDEDVLLAYRYDDADLTPAHGYPLRLLVPKLYFWKSAKWLRGLEFMAQDRLGFWERNGYNNEADPWKEQRFA